MNLKRFLIFYFLFFLLIISGYRLNISSSENRDILFVGGVGEGNYSSIQDAISYSKEGNKIFVYNGIYNESIRIHKKLTLIGENKNFTILTNDGKNDIIYITANSSVLKGFSILNCSNTSFSGINIASSDNTIYGNIIADNKGWGIYLYYSLSNNISNNSFFNDSINIVGDLDSWNTHYMENNTVNGKPLIYLKNISNMVLNDESGQVLIANCSNIDISDLSIQNSDQAILFGYSNNCTISNNSLYLNRYGISLYFSNENAIFDNKLFENDYGLYLTHSDYNKIYENNISYNNLFGCWICCKSSNNTVFQNDFLFNRVNAYDLINNKWYFNKVGNYWSDYEGFDENDDGIGDTPYDGILPDGRNIDMYPIINIDEKLDDNKIIGFEISLILFLLILFSLIFRKFN